MSAPVPVAEVVCGRLRWHTPTPVSDPASKFLNNDTHPLYDAAALSAAVAAARRAALEEAARLCESTYPELIGGDLCEFLCFGDSSECAAAIRALADKGSA